MHPIPDAPPFDTHFALDRGQVLTLPARPGTVVSVQSGTLWITRHGDRRDHLLSGGDSLALDRQGPAVLSATRACDLVLSRRLPVRQGIVHSLLPLFRSLVNRPHTVVHQP